MGVRPPRLKVALMSHTARAPRSRRPTKPNPGTRDVAISPQPSPAEAATPRPVTPPPQRDSALEENQAPRSSKATLFALLWFAIPVLLLVLAQALKH